MANSLQHNMQEPQARPGTMAGAAFGMGGGGLLMSRLLAFFGDRWKRTRRRSLRSSLGGPKVSSVDRAQRKSPARARRGLEG